MKKERSKAQGINKKIVKTVLWLVVTLFVLLLSLVTVVQIPYVQTRVLQRISHIISNKTGFPTSIERVNIKWFDVAVFDSIAIYDQEQCPMILVDRLVVDFDIRTGWDNGNIYIDEAELNNGAVYLIKDTATSTLNVTAFINQVRELTRKKNKSPSKRYAQFNIEQVSLNNVRFSYYDQGSDILTDRFDYNHFSLDSIYADARNLRVVADTLEVDIQQMSGYQAVHDLKVHNFRGKYWFSDRTMAFENFEMHAGESVLRDSVVLHYDSKNSLGYFNDSVTIKARIRDTKLDTRDLALFAPTLRPYRDVFTATGDFSGEVSDFSVRNLELYFGRSSRLTGVVSFAGLPAVKETFVDLELKNSVVQPQDVRQYVNNESAYQNALKFGRVTFNTQFLGFPNDFVANGFFQTKLGDVKSDINLKLEDLPVYSGNLALTDFDLGTLTQRPDLLHKTSFKGFVAGSGVTLEDAHFDLKASFDYLDLNKYRYQNINTDARLAKSFFEGQLGIADPNLRFNGSGTVDLRDGREAIKIQARLDTALLHALNLTQDRVFISTSLDANTQGFKVDDLVGDARFEDLSVSYDERQLAIDTLWFKSRLGENQHRSFALGTERINASLEGDFQFTTLLDEVPELISEYQLIFKNDKEQLARYYANEQAEQEESDQQQRYEIDYDIALKDVNPLLNLFVPQIALSPNVHASGRFTGGYTSIFSLQSHIDTLRYQDHLFYDNDIDITTSKIVDSTDVLASAYFHSERQDFASEGLNAQMRDLTLDAVWADDHIDFQQRIKQRGTSNYANLSGELTFLEDSTFIHLNPSELSVLNDRWYFSDNNRVLLSNGEVQFSDFQLYQPSSGEKRQSVALVGALSPDTEQLFTLRVDHFQVNNLSPILKKDYQGEVNGYADIRNAFVGSVDTANHLALNSELSVTQFAIEGFEVGDIVSLVNWDGGEGLMDVNLMVDRDRQRIVTLGGTYNPIDSGQLQLLATFQKANIDIVEPFVEDYFSEIRGLVSGEFSIMGTLNAPVLRGEGVIADGHLKINYLNTQYQVDGGIFFDDSAIGIRTLTLLDDRNQRAVFSGEIAHQQFSQFALNLEGTLSNVTVLNTSLKDNDLFYGNAYATGTVSLRGALNNLTIAARAKTDKGTRFYIPIGGVGGVEQSEFIRFVDYTDTTLTINDKVGKADLTGLTLDLDIEVTPDAYGEIIFDAKTGDIIRGRGAGQLQMLISSAGEFSMFGDLTLQQGGYNFTLYNVINKEFAIQPGSNISWQGDPYGARLNIQATYDQLASLAPLVLDEQARESDEVRRNYKAQVLLDITGDLMAPQIDFDIDINEYPRNNTNLLTAVETLENSATLDPEELKRQVFSLIVLRRFSERGSFDGSSAVSGSVSELLSNQFSYWLSQVDENLEIDVNLGTFDDDRFNTFQVRLSYSLFDGRLRVTRDGGFTDVNNQASTASVIGDVTVEYLLTPDGKYRIKMYNRSNANTLTQAIGQVNNNLTSQGISLQYVESFDKVSELLNETRNRALRWRKKSPEEPSDKPVTSAGEDESKQADNTYQSQNGNSPNGSSPNGSLPNSNSPAGLPPSELLLPTAPDE